MTYKPASAIVSSPGKKNAKRSVAVVALAAAATTMVSLRVRPNG